MEQRQLSLGPPCFLHLLLWFPLYRSPRTVSTRVYAAAWGTRVHGRSNFTGRIFASVPGRTLGQRSSRFVRAWRALAGPLAETLPGMETRPETATRLVSSLSSYTM